MGEVNSQQMIDRGEDVLWRERPFLDLFRLGVSGPNDLAHAHPAAGEQSEVHGRPVISAHMLIDTRTTTEFTPSQDGDFLIQAALV